MDGGGFEPPKQFAADLQSVPFGHSGIHPKISHIQLSVSPTERFIRILMKCPVPESNQRHVDFQSTALPTELTGLNSNIAILNK